MHPRSTLSGEFVTMDCAARGSRPRSWWRGASLAFLLAVAGAGCGADPFAGRPAEPAVPARDDPTGGPADDENEITPPDKTPEEGQVEEEPPPPAATPTPVPTPTPTPTRTPTPTPTPTPIELRSLCFSPREDCLRRLLSYLQAEPVGIDMPIYHLYDHRISEILVAKHRAGVRVRVIADRHAYRSKPQHAREMNYLAAQGIPVRTGRFRGIVHTKTTILHGLGLVEMGSMNYTSIASRKIFNGRTGQVEWNEELAFFTTNPQVFARFAERFERMWQNTGEGREAFLVFRAGMALPTFDQTEAAKPVTCYEDPVDLPPDDPDLDVCFAPDQDCNREVVGPLLRKEKGGADVFMFRATSRAVSDPLIALVKAGKPVRVIFDKAQRENTALYPNMARIIRELWAANTAGNLELKATAHPGYMHMKGIATPSVALWGSGNYSLSSSTRVRGCQNTFYQHEDMVVTRDPGLIAQMHERFEEMWTNGDFETFIPDMLEGGSTEP